MGEPAILDEHGRKCELRGNQAWAVLARILLSKRPIDRRRLSAELFADTADPLGTLRWCLAALRRALDEPTAFRGDPIQGELPLEVRVDLNTYESGEDIPAEIGDLLDGVDLRGSPTFSTWLLVERQRVAGLVEESLRRSCLAALSRGDVATAVRFAEQGVRRAPFDEAFHVLLVKSFVAAGRIEAALTHTAATEAAFHAELGVAPSPALRSAARRTIMAPEAGVSRVSHARSLLEAGKAAISAGAVDAGIDTLRRAVNEAEQAGAVPLRGEALLELGTALVHAVRGFDDEGAVLLHQAAELAGKCGFPVQRAAALRELGYLDALAGRRTSAATYLADASSCAEAPGDLAGIQSVIAFNLVDWGRVEEGLAAYEYALELSRSAGNRRREAWCLGIGARGWLEVDKPEEALSWLDKCLRLIEDLRWVAFRPWAVALRAQAWLLLGESPSLLRSDLEDAFALSCQLRDPCWEGANSRIIARTYSKEGNLSEAARWLDEALTRTCRDADRFAAQQVDILEDQVRLLALRGRHKESRSAAEAWVSLAARTQMDRSIRRAVDFMTGM